MRAVTIVLPDALYAELETASSKARELGFGPQAWAQEAVESALASRRLPSVAVGRCGARVFTAVEDPEPEAYRVHFPEAVTHE